MATDDLKMKAKAAQLVKAGHTELEGYRKMDSDELRKLIAKIDKAGKGKPTIEKTTKAAGNGSAKGRKAAATAEPAAAKSTKGKAKVSATKGKGKVATATKGKTAPAAKSAAQKSAPTKGKAAQGKASRAVTPTAAPGKCKTEGHGRRKAVNTRGRYANLCADCVEEAKANNGTTKGKQVAVKAGRKTATVAKGRKTAAPAKRKTAATLKPAKIVKGKQGEASKIDRSNIDWKLDTSVGRRAGKRHDVMALLRKKNGNYDKVYEALEDDALTLYPNALNTYPESPNRKHAARRMLRWLIARVALDYVNDTGQHTPGTRQAQGTSERTQDVARRKARVAAAKAQKGGKKVAAGKPATKGRKTAAPAKGKGKSAPAKGKVGKGKPAKGKGRK